MLDAIKPLLDSDLINEEAQQQISEAWEAKLNEAREQVRAELREEFAQRYEHDKNSDGGSPGSYGNRRSQDRT
jgi:hypothetical protein